MVNKLLITPLSFYLTLLRQRKLVGAKPTHPSRLIVPRVAFSHLLPSPTPNQVRRVDPSSACRSHGHQWLEMPFRWSSSKVESSPSMALPSISLALTIRRCQLSIPSATKEVRLAYPYTPSVHSGPMDLAHGSTSTGPPRRPTNRSSPLSRHVVPHHHGAVNLGLFA